MLHLKKDATIPSRRDILKGVKEVRGVFPAQIAKRLEGQHLSVTTGGWTSCANDTYHSFTVSLTDDGWNMTRSLDCSKATGSAKGEDLAESVIAQVEKHKLEGRVTAFTTDCEPSMVKAGRLVEEQGVAEHHGCCNHRLHCTTGIVFNGPGMQETMALSRLVVRRYTTSSQAAQRLGESQEFLLSLIHI